MKGLTVAVIWGFVIMLVLAITYPIWSWAINSITTSASGDNVTILLVDSIFIILVIATIGAIVLYKENPRLDQYA